LGETPAANAAPKIFSVGALAGAILSSLDEAKAEDVISIDLKGKTALADLMVIASGRSTVHVGAIADRVIKACKAAGVAAPRVEGLPQCDWVLIDVGDLIIHIFRPEVRQFYNLEKMWGGDRPRELRLA
jgi:ribosome-associated protein